jgi:large subunit ribosomal protein L35Ae
VNVMARSTQGTIVNYHIGPKSQNAKECIIQFRDLTSVSKACMLIGRKVVWKEGTNKIVGKIVTSHGKNGLLLARFRRGVPGQALGTSVELVG